MSYCLPTIHHATSSFPFFLPLPVSLSPQSSYLSPSLPFPLLSLSPPPLPLSLSPPPYPSLFPPTPPPGTNLIHKAAYAGHVAAVRLLVNKVTGGGLQGGLGGQVQVQGVGVGGGGGGVGGVVGGRLSLQVGGVW